MKEFQRKEFYELKNKIAYIHISAHSQDGRESIHHK